MNRVKRLIAYVTAAIIAVTCSGVVSLVSASAAAKITSVKIVSYPKKTEFVQGADWDYGYYDMPEGGGLGTFVSDSRYISFKHYGGYYTRYADRGMIDMNGLVVKVTYSDGTSENIAYKETVSGTAVTQNIFASPTTDYKLGENIIEVYFKSNTAVYDSYKINIVKTASVKGDVNSDGKVNSTDALLVLQHVVGSKTIGYQYLHIADMDGDGQINSFDALQILRKSVALV